MNILLKSLLLTLSYIIKNYNDIKDDLISDYQWELVNKLHNTLYLKFENSKTLE